MVTDGYRLLMVNDRSHMVTDGYRLLMVTDRSRMVTDGYRLLMVTDRSLMVTDTDGYSYFIQGFDFSLHSGRSQMTTTLMRIDPVVLTIEP